MKCSCGILIVSPDTYQSNFFLITNICNDISNLLKVVRLCPSIQFYVARLVC